MSDTWPGDDELAALFAGVRARDPLAVHDFVVAVLEPLVADLRPRHADEDARHTAAEDALLDLIRDPARYDPAKATLRGYLRMAARRDLGHVADKERRHHVGRKSSEFVELAAGPGNSHPNAPADDLPSFDAPHLAAEIDSFDADERAVFEAMREGARATAEFAAALGLGHLSPDDQFDAVKRVKDRIKKRLQRAAEGHS